KDGFNYKEGTSEECAKATCPKNKWTVKRKGVANPEKYVGAVECSSDEATEGQWVIDGKTEIEEASCFIGTVSCTEAATLETKCDPNWKKCTALLLDNNAKTCETGKTMFYKRRGEYAFEEASGASITCNKDDGTWTVAGTAITTTILTRGDAVICAGSNPMPTTTTPQPPPGDEVCKTCENILNCGKDTCSDPPKIQVELVKDEKFDKCVMKSGNITNKKFQTEKDGKVDGSELFCNRTQSEWKTKSGEPAGKVSLFVEKKEAEDSDPNMLIYIVLGSVGGIVLLIVIFIVIFKLCIAKRKPDDKDEETKRKMLEESKKKKKK
ncbi:hypothetical protein PMAYCL1PPCAC_03300, partial [Pristionchus mayeri]